MKFQKGLLDDLIEESKAPDARSEEPAAEPNIEILRPLVQPQTPAAEAERPVIVVEKDRLFETAQKTTESSRNYLKLFGIVVVLIAIGAAVVIYLTLPGVGDRIRVSREMEDGVRNHFLEKEKRTAGDITFYKCDKYTWAHTEVETRTDIPGNPLAKVSAYATKIVDRGDNTFEISATPITSTEMDTPCR